MKTQFFGKCSRINSYDIILENPVELRKLILNNDKAMSMVSRWIWLQPVCAPFAPRLRPVYTLGRILNTRTRTGPDSTGNHRGLPQWEACCTVGPSAQWIFRRIAQTQANTEASPFLSRPAKHKGLFSGSRSFLREESSIVPTYGEYWQLFQSRTYVKPRDPFKDSPLL